MDKEKKEKSERKKIYKKLYKKWELKTKFRLNRTKNNVTVERIMIGINSKKIDCFVCQHKVILVPC